MTVNPIGSLGYRDVYDALAEQKFVPYFHPIHDVNSGALTGAEILARLPQYADGLYLPADFLSHMAAPEDLKKLTSILLIKAGLWFAGKPLPDNFSLAFNIPADMVCEPWLLELCQMLLSRSMGKITLVAELSESLPLTVGAESLDHGLQQMALAGVTLALDDFGTGYSGYHLLRQTGAGMIKIPREFVSVMNDDLVSSRIIDNMMHLADSLSLLVVAEGVETPEQVKALAEKGVQYAQGYFYSPPLSEAEFSEYLMLHCD